VNIVSNQRRAFLAQAKDDARRLTHSLRNLSEAQRAAIIAIVAERSETPVDIVLLADHGDAREVAETTAGLLRRGETSDTYKLGSGCLFQVVPAPGEDDPR
jgi:hypothetical protein